MENVQNQEEKSAIDFQLIYTTLILNWKWFILSIILCLGLGYLYLQHAKPVFQTTTKVLIKDDDQSKRGGGMNSSMIQSAANLGFMTNSNGIDNEIEILSASDMARQAVIDMKTYVNYYHKGIFRSPLVYKEQEINVDMDAKNLQKLNAPVKLSIEKDGKQFHVTGKYYIPIDAFTHEKDPIEFEKTINGLPATINTRAGAILLTANKGYNMEDGDVLKAVIVSPEMAAEKYVKNLTVSQTSKTTTIAELVLNDENPQRGLDYLHTLIKVYNQQANLDKNEIAYRTEQFINNRLEKINSELGTTENQLESYTASLTNHGNLYLTRIGHLVLNLGCNLIRELDTLLIAHLVGAHDDTKLTTCLDGIGLGNARIAHGDSFKIVQSLDICLYNLTAGTWTGT